MFAINYFIALSNPALVIPNRLGWEAKSAYIFPIFTVNFQLFSGRYISKNCPARRAVRSHVRQYFISQISAIMC